MEVEIRAFATFRDALGAGTLRREVPGNATVGDLLRTLEGEFPELEGSLLDDDGNVPASVTVLRNGEPVARLEGTATPLSENDRVALSLPVTGGATAGPAR